MLTGLHFLLTYKCNSKCDHCFVYSSPNAPGTFTLNQIRRHLDEAIKIPEIETVVIASSNFPRYRDEKSIIMTNVNSHKAIDFVMKNIFA